VQRSLLAAAAALAGAFLAAGCGAEAKSQEAFYDPHSRPIGRGAEFHPRPTGPIVAGARAVRGLECRRGGPRRYGVHLEIFARRLVVIIPPGIGVAPPLTRRGAAYVVGGRCFYPARTIEPTGVIQVAQGAKLTLGDFFALWGQPLSRTRLLSFQQRGGASIRAFYNGRPWRGAPAAIPLTHNAEITLEVNGFVPVRVGYRFRPGL
jgi:hypothetical protein